MKLCFMTVLQTFSFVSYSQKEKNNSRREKNEKVLAIITAIVMMVMMMPVAALAEQAAAVKTEAPAKENDSNSIIVKDEQPAEAAEETVAEQEVPLYGMVEENMETENVPLVNYVRNAEKNEAAAESTGCSLADMMLMIATMVAAAGF